MNVAGARRPTCTIVACLACAFFVACGKKGPPLPPIVRVPAAVDALEVRRVGADVYVTFRLPSQNVDGSTPADLSRVELFALTSATPPAARFLEAAMPVGAISLAPMPGERTGEGAVQGGEVTLREQLPAAAVTARPMPEPAGAGDAAGDGPLRRYYAVAAYSARGLSSGPGTLAELPLIPLPPPPSGVTATYDPERVRLAWTPASPDTSARPDGLPEDPDLRGAPGPIRFNVYRVAGPGTPVDSSADHPPPPVNAEPLDVPGFSEPVALDGLERCYAVRAVSGAGPLTMEGEPSRPACVTPADTFPPAAPRGLSAVALQGAISLIWEANEEPDLDGYLVLRGEPGDATLAPLTGEPVRATQFEDRTVVAGRRYVYAIVAVDRQQPPNVSAESDRVEETAR